MSETTEIDPVEIEVVTEKPDDSDPQIAVQKLREELTETQNRYQQQLAAARASQQRERQANEQLRTVSQDKTSLEFSTLSNALEAAQARESQLKGDYARALEAGEYANAAQIQADMARLGARIETLEAGKFQMEQARNQQLRDPTPQVSEVDPIEADLSGRDARTAAWLRKHADSSGRPRFYTDPQFQARVIGAHNLAMGNGLTEHSPEYFDFVERTAGVATQITPPVQAREVPTAAPARSAGGQNQSRVASTHIPAEAVRWAKQIGVDPADYWAEHQRMERAGEFKAGAPFKRSA